MGRPSIGSSSGTTKPAGGSATKPHLVSTRRILIWPLTEHRSPSRSEIVREANTTSGWLTGLATSRDGSPSIPRYRRTATSSGPAMASKSRLPLRGPAIATFTPRTSTVSALKHLCWQRPSTSGPRTGQMTDDTWPMAARRLKTVAACSPFHCSETESRSP